MEDYLTDQNALEISGGESCCCGENGKKTMRSDAEQKKLVQRLKRIQGQINGIQRMLENNAYCIDILTQSAAARGALDAFNRELLEHHIRGCVVRDVQAGNESTIDELLKILSRLVK